jgi:hypothetical protein
MMLRDKYGWPVETIKGRYFWNILRLFVKTDVWKTLVTLRTEES